MLTTFADVERALTRYADAFQPRSGSLTVVSNRGGGGGGFPFHPALLDDLEDREELRRRMAWLPEYDAALLVRWYIAGARPEAIARELGRSVRHVYRRRSEAVSALVALGRQEDFADADVSEFA